MKKTVLSIILLGTLLTTACKDVKNVDAKIWFKNQIKLTNESSDTVSVKVIINKTKNMKGFYKKITILPNSTNIVSGFFFKGVGANVFGNKKISSLEVSNYK